MNDDEPHSIVRKMLTSDLIRCIVDHEMERHLIEYHPAYTPGTCGDAWTRERAAAAAAELNCRIPIPQ